MNTSSECSDDDDYSAHKPPKRMKRARKGQYKFNDAWLKDDSFKNWLLKLENDAQNVHCRICVSNITIKHRGVSALTSHMQGDRHRKNVQHTLSEHLLNFYNESDLNQDQEQSFDNVTFKLSSLPLTTPTVMKRKTEIQQEDNFAINHLNTSNNESEITAPTVLPRKSKNVSRQEECLNLPVARLLTPKDEYEQAAPKTAEVTKRKIGSREKFPNPAIDRLREEIREEIREAIPPTRVIKKWKNRYRHDELLNLAINHLNASKNEYETVASAWAIELQKMDAEQQIFAKRFINEIIFEGQMGCLHRNSLNMQHAQWYPSPASSSAEAQNHVSDNSINHNSNS